jgi:H/ACA ribonucleoprotein complex subunit 4
MDEGKSINTGPRKTFTISGEPAPVSLRDLIIKRPDNMEISIEELLRSGVINLNKPMGPTSHQVSSWVKRMFEVEKVGHGGTLDPRVTGVLPMAFYGSARILDILTYSPKEYIGVMRIHSDIPHKKVKLVCSEFVGPIYQFPPVRSAVKRQLRIRTIHSLELLDFNSRDVLFKVECASGTYIRSLVHDIGLVLGTGAHMQELRRTRTGPFHEREANTLQELKDAIAFFKEDGEEKYLRACLKTMETLLLDIPKIMIHDSAVDAVCHGADLAVPGISQFEDIQHTGEPMGIITQKGEGVAIGEAMMITPELLREKSGIAVKTNRVLMPTGTYQKGWKGKDTEE